MGVTAIWLAPIFKNKPVQGPPGQEIAGYHGYWVTDFTSVDPHLGTNADFKALVDAAHARGMKVYMDIIANHTADVIQYKGCPIQACGYRSIADYPYQRRGGPGGAAINPGFEGDRDRSPDNFARLTNPNFAYEVEVPAAEKSVKVPGLAQRPDLVPQSRQQRVARREHDLRRFLRSRRSDAPSIRAWSRGLIEVFGSWIDRFGIDGFRIDTAKHVNPEFWQAFVPAMLERAKAEGIPNFHIFGEVYQDTMEPGMLARAHRASTAIPSVLDFAFRAAALQTVAGDKGTGQSGSGCSSATRSTKAARTTARQLPTFLSNHDAGRFSMFVRRAFPKASDDEVLDRVDAWPCDAAARCAACRRSIRATSRASSATSGDQGAREDMFAEQGRQLQRQQAARHRPTPPPQAISTPAIRSTA